MGNSINLSLAALRAQSAGDGHIVQRVSAG